MSSFRIDVADLLRHPGARRTVRLTEPLEGLAGSAAVVTDPVAVVLDLERISEGIVVRGTISATWRGDCARCLTPLHRPLELHVDELFEPDPVPGETYLLDGHELDVDQLARDTVLLELPLAPHCDPPCPLPSQASDDAEPDVDPRWRALSELEL
ncbi:MAG TPA: DUF177 domain-containing protein [Acidimicrobiia bacterium]